MANCCSIDPHTTTAVTRISLSPLAEDMNDRSTIALFPHHLHTRMHEPIHRRNIPALTVVVVVIVRDIDQNVHPLDAKSLTRSRQNILDGIAVIRRAEELEVRAQARVQRRIPLP